LDRLQEGRLPDGWNEPRRAFRERAVPERSTRSGIKLSGDIVDAFVRAISDLISAAPDLDGATQHKRSLASFTAADHSNRYGHYGIREHTMSAMMNGMAAHGGVAPGGRGRKSPLTLHDSLQRRSLGEGSGMRWATRTHVGRRPR
jgi:transketolase